MSTDNEDWARIASVVDPGTRTSSPWTVEALLGLSIIQGLPIGGTEVVYPPWDDTGESLIAKQELAED
jgi:hypothetical protein